VLDIGTLNLVRIKDENGDKLYNAADLANKLQTATASTEEKPAAEKPAEEQKVEEGKPVEFIIHHLQVKTSKVRIADFTGSMPRVIERDISLNIEMREMTSVKQISLEATRQAAPQVLVLLTGVQLQMGGSNAKDAVNDALNGGANLLNDKASGLLNSLKDKINSESKKKK
jgi:hypothetical protein